MADMTMSCAVEDTTMRAEMPARMTSETAACAREDTEAYARAALPSERTDRTSKRVNDHDAVDESRTCNADPIGVRRKEAGPADTPACTPPIFAMTGRAPVSTMR